MWMSVGPQEAAHEAPSARAKHSATLIGENLYVLGGRNGNLPTKDFWKYNLGKWKQLKPSGDKLPILQEHTAVPHKDRIYVFGGEVGFSAGTETPLWVYELKGNTWKKLRTKKGVSTPIGRRGHTSLVYNGTMLIYGGYQDLRGSCGDLWAFHFETESWHLLWSPPAKSADYFPAPRHKHSAVIHDESMWIYGGMTDLQERNDFWRWNIREKTWHNIKIKINPGPLHSHACCKVHSAMIIFGGERGGQSSNELWKYSFDLEFWEKIPTAGPRPRPRSECASFAVSELLLQTSCKTSVEYKSARVRLRTCSSADRGNRHSSYLPNNKIAPSERTYVFEPSEVNYVDGSNLAQQYSDNQKSAKSFLQEITKLSQLNITRKCSYTILNRGQATDSTESLLRQHSCSPQQEVNGVATTDVVECPTLVRGASMTKSKSAYVIDDDSKDHCRKKKVEFDTTIRKIPRDPISVPNFSVFNLPPTVLTPVEASKLVYLDAEEENEYVGPVENPLLYVNPAAGGGDSYSSHLAYADVYHQEAPKKGEESSTSDYASIETVNRLSSNSSYSVVHTPADERGRTQEREGPFGFCNPNYVDPSARKRDDAEETLEMQSYDGIIDKDTRVVYRSCRSSRPSNLLLAENSATDKPRALSASRAEKRAAPVGKGAESTVPLYVYVVGGKEQGHVTVFQRPISIWKFKLV
ncbi:uncharacterized protein LOC132704051 isoform X2 [Cylas formicarius]|uniref:uncharacterized protein LOC132704051 isoform X2 n=1 Tax=Cylas formicarius TaxID=197179 RepID=UPI0029585EEF|nr:uncharacterized protein LOC132704051 isoform X2 [Cylas formicarius]